MTKDEYNHKYLENTKITGFGLETTVHMPCPFCTEPNFVSYRILDVEFALKQNNICRRCERGATVIFKKSEQGTSLEMVQTSGDDPPDYINWIRRISN